MKNRIIVALIGLSGYMFFIPVVYATPLSMNYQITDQGGGQYLYDFQLVLDNNDDTWVAGQGWDWIVFGDRAGGYPNNSAFNTTPGAGVNIDWTFTSLSQALSGTTTSGGSEGPTVYTGANALAPTWIPASTGESLTWSGISGVLVPDGGMYWSAIITEGGASAVSYALANNTTSVPEPGTIALLGLGLIGLRFSRKRNKI